MILSSTNSVNELYNPENVFTFDETNVYSQHPTFVSTAVEEPHPGYLQRDNSYVKEMIEEMKAEKVDVIDDYMRMLLHRVKHEGDLTEVEYGKLLMRIECGEVSDVCNVLEDSISSYIRLIQSSVVRTLLRSTRLFIPSETTNLRTQKNPSLLQTRIHSVR